MRNHVGLFLVLILILVLQIPAFHDDLWWDASVYYGMGKYLYSNGEIGLWEHSRPLVLPLIFGFLWKIGLSISSIKALSVMFSLGVICITYLISLELFKDKAQALLAALAVGLFPVFFSFGARSLSEIPSTLLLLLGAYLILKKNYPLSGLFFGIAVMTRFFQVFAVIGVLFFIGFQCYKKRMAKEEMVYFSLLFSLPIMLFLIFNAMNYGDPLLPFKAQAYLTQHTGEIYSEPFPFYFIELLKNNLLLLFVIAGFFSIKRQETLALILLLLSVVPYLFIEHKELRLLLPAIPFLSIYMVKGYFQLCRGRLVFSVLFVSIVCLNWYTHFEKDQHDDGLDYFKEYLEENDVGNTWISSPQMVVESDVKVSELMYYPGYDSEKIDELTRKLPHGNTLLINSCDLLCPKEDVQCPEKNNEFMGKLRQSFSMEHQEQEGCEYYVFSNV